MRIIQNSKLNDGKKGSAEGWPVTDPELKLQQSDGTILLRKDLELHTWTKI